MASGQKSYIVTLHGNEDLDRAADDIAKLAKAKQDKVEIGLKLKEIGVLQISCKAAFAAAVRKMPSVAAVEEEHDAHASRGSKKGPSI